MRLLTNLVCLAAAVALVTAAAPGADASCDSWIDKAEAGYKVTFLSRTYDGGADNTEFCWRVDVDADFSSKTKIKALSHWVIGVCEGSTLVSTSGPDAEGILNTDPTTGLYGHKWDHELDDGESQEYCITLAGDLPTSATDATYDGQATTKGGKICSIGPVEGPGCKPNEGCPTDPCDNAGHVRNTDTCECECVNKDVPCDFPGQERDADTCECQCLALPICVAPAELVGCECVCDPSGAAEAACVSADGFWNSDACRCDDEPPITVCKTVKAKCGCPLIKDWDSVDCIKIEWVEDDSGRCDDK